MKVEEIDPAVIESVCARLHEHLPGEDAAQAEEFVRQYYRWVPPADMAERGQLDLYGAALCHFNFLRERMPGATKVRVFNPQFEVDGWQSSHTSVEIVTDDMPFLIDSVSMELIRRGFGIHLVIHPVMAVQRNADGVLTHIMPPQPTEPQESLLESVMHIEVDRETSQYELETLRDQVMGVIAEVRSAVEDWPLMREQALKLAKAAKDPETAAFLEWLETDNYTFLGYRDGKTGLGVLRERDTPQLGTSDLTLTKADERATVHRPAYLDYVGVGDAHFVGLYSHTAYHASPRDIPILRRKYDAVLARASFPHDSHNEKALIEILESYPRDELFQIGADDLFETAMGILHLGERQRLRLFIRRDEFDRFLSCLVFVPRDRFNTDNRRRIEGILTDAFGAESIDYTTRVSESVLVRLHYMVYVKDRKVPAFDVEEIEEQILVATRSWTDDLEDALVEELGEEQGISLCRRWGSAFPPAYRADWVARSAVLDIGRIELLGPDSLSIVLYRPLEAAPGALRAKLFRTGAPLSLSDVLPLFENMGVKVADERPYELRPADGPTVWIYDFGLAFAGAGKLEASEVRETFQEAFMRAWLGEIENDGYNRLVLGAGLAWREVSILRAVARYLRQGGTNFSDTYVEEAVVAHAQIARKLVDLFAARFDPDLEDRAPAGELAQQIELEIDAVESLDQDQILRSFLAVVEGMLRTNYYQRDLKSYLSFKLDPSKLTFLPQPRPLFEIFVYSPRIEGVHLRGGRVARGGLRWSDRREDFRTEVLGLMKAQMVKNAVIVPVGAKGGFVLKRPDEPVVRGYSTFIRGLLDITDNIVGGEIVPPDRVVRYDADDPYLVVAADKGTATFSDIANGIAEEYGFWLGDAFASGGSSGYDHKKMGITARGAWESVKRHFREMGQDSQSEDFTVAGIGDMSGDVFGNGMLLSEHIRLVAAFNHREIFIDPDPDPASSFKERSRMFALERSSWSDYDTSKISAGGGVFPRTAKSIPLSPEAREALGTDAESATPNELMRIILQAPVDLLWNGGIGTYVKADDETHAAAGDKANDPLRVNAGELRCKVIGEGGNLGLTQRGRIQYAMAGGRLNTDAIDNSAGVDCSDHEVNIKILLNTAVAEGDLTVKQRNVLLEEMTEEVGKLVLKDNYEQTETLSLAETQADGMLDVHARLLDTLEQTRNLNRELEALPDDEEIAERKGHHGSLTRPELATLLAFAKIDVYSELLDSDVPEDPYLSSELEAYFPAPLPERFGDRLREHRLRREIIATQIANNVIHGGGSTFVFRIHEETGAPASEVARAYTVAREIFQMRPIWWEIEKLDNAVPAETQTAMLLEGRRVIERASRWLLRNRKRPMDIAETVAYFAPGAAALYESMPGILVKADAEPIVKRADTLVKAGVPDKLAMQIASMGTMYSALDIVEVADECGLGVEEVAAVHFRLGAVLQLHWLRDRITALPRDDRWRALSRAAMRDDLYSIHRSLTAATLQETESGLDAEKRVKAWVAHNPAVERYQQTLADVKVGRVFDMTTMPVLVREARNLLH